MEKLLMCDKSNETCDSCSESSVSHENPFSADHPDHRGRRLTQTTLTVHLQGIPSEVRSHAALTAFLDSVFPGEVFAVNLTLMIPGLITAHNQRLKVVHSTTCPGKAQTWPGIP